MFLCILFYNIVYGNYMIRTNLQSYYDRLFPPKPFTDSEKAALVGMVVVPSVMSNLACWHVNRCYQGMFQNLCKRNCFFAFPIGLGLGKIHVITSVAILSLESGMLPHEIKKLEKRIEKETHHKRLMKESDWKVCLEGPILEELIFRGLLQPIFVRTLGVSPGIAVTAILFGTMHNLAPKENRLSFFESWYKKPEMKIVFDLESASGLMQASSAAIGGIFFGVLRQQYGLLASIGAHIGNNCAVNMILKL